MALDSLLARLPSVSDLDAKLTLVLGCKVIAAAGSEDKREIARKMGGADYVVDYGKKGWQDEVKKITGGHGVDVVYDPVGMLVPSLKCIAWNGRLVVVGFAAGEIEKVPANLVLLKNCSIVGLFWGATASEYANEWNLGAMCLRLATVRWTLADGSARPQALHSGHSGGPWPHLVWQAQAHSLRASL